MIEKVLTSAKKNPVVQYATAWGELRAGEGVILIAWQLLFSLFPLVIGMLSIAGLVLRDPARLTAIADAIASQFPKQASELVGVIIETRDLGGIFGIVSVVGLLWSGSNLFGTMAIAFNRFYRAPDRSFVWQRAMSFAMMAVYAVLISVTVASSSAAGFLVGISSQVLPFELPYFAFLLGWVISLASAILMFLVLYRFVPNAGLRLWHVWKGAVLAGVLFVALTQIFPLYLRFLGGGFAAYKALGIFLLLMTWFYFLGMILCAGALLNAILENKLPEPVAEAARKTSAGPGDTAGAAHDSAPSGTVKVVMWAGLTASVTSLTLILARRLAGSLWRSLTRQEPPS